MARQGLPTPHFMLEPRNDGLLRAEWNGRAARLVWLRHRPVFLRHRLVWLRHRPVWLRHRLVCAAPTTGLRAARQEFSEARSGRRSSHQGDGEVRKDLGLQSTGETIGDGSPRTRHRFPRCRTTRTTILRGSTCLSAGWCFLIRRTPAPHLVKPVLDKLRVTEPVNPV